MFVKDTAVAISTPADGVCETKMNAESGKATSAAVRAAFLRYSDNVTIYPDCSNISCLKSKHSMTQGYYVVPVILHWEDRATKWSGIPDKIEIQITIYDATTNNRLASTIISGKSKWASFGGDHPQDLLAAPVNSYISA